MSADIRDRDDETVLVWIEGVLAAIGSVRSPGPAGKWQCPAHARVGEHAPSLALGVRDGGGAWMYCHAGCTAKQICHALGMTLDHLARPQRLSAPAWVRARRLAVGFPAPKDTGTPRSRGLRHEAFHHYGTRFRLERLRHPVTGEKAVEWEFRTDAASEAWMPGLNGTRVRDLPLYRETDLALAIGAGETVLVVESESSVDALNRAGWYATTWAGGAGSPPLERVAALLAGHRPVVIVGDADEPGRRCSARLAEVLPRAVVLTSEREGEDARDLHTRLGAGGFAELVASALTDRAPARVA